MLINAIRSACFMCCLRIYVKLVSLITSPYMRNSRVQHTKFFCVKRTDLMKIKLSYAAPHQHCGTCIEGDEMFAEYVYV